MAVPNLLAVVELALEVEGGGGLEHFESGDRPVLQLAPQAQQLLG